MLLEKKITGYNGRLINASRYQCDMCKKNMIKDQRISIYLSEPGGDVQRKGWDVCEKCMKIIDKNIKMWYDRAVKK